MLKHILTASICSILTFHAANADSIKTSTPDSHAPLGVMGDHLHKQGEWMAAYKYEYSKSTGLRNGNNHVSNASVLAVYGEAATEMDMGMHMFELMYGVSDELTLMVMPQYMNMSMTHKSSHGGGHSHEHETSGFGDTEVTALYSLFHAESGDVNHKVHLNAGLSLPTGSITETFVDHHNNTYRMPYNMQFGSGTYDPIIGATYNGRSTDWSWGAQTLNTIRVGKNNVGYRQGNKYTGTTWVARNLTDFASVSFRLEGEAWGNVSGQDSSLPFNAIAGANPNEQAGERVMANIGLNLLAGKEQGIFAGHRLAAEFGLPLYERYSGPQSDTDYRLTVGWQYAF